MYDDEPSAAGRPWIRQVVFGVVAVAVVAAAALLMYRFLAVPSAKPKGVHNVALIKQPPPPPPKPPEKQPEPDKVKEEVKIDQPKDMPRPDEPKAADEKPASDKPLGIDAEGTAGSDGFGLAGNKGGRDLLTTGGGVGGAYYSGLLQRHFFEALSRNRKVLKQEFRVVVKVWFGDDGRVQKADIVSGSGNAQLDEQIQLALLEIAPLKDVPPASMRPMQVRLSNRS
jgi:outer membrane biosynthesis protein TonB